MSRTVTANINLTLDGRYTGPDGDLGPIVRYATTEVARRHLARIWDGATTAVLGRVNAQGFLGFWPSVADNEDAHPQDRAYAQWLVDVEKVVLSSTLTEAPWKHTRIANAPTTKVIEELKESTKVGDILINSSASVITRLLAANLVDRLHLMITPEIAGTGHRLFDTDLPPSRWTLTHHETGPSGETTLTYTRHHPRPPTTTK
ncbi:dihydrofolate reductase family protein [Saccharothrix violaceirubra]|uniref:Dihydrofolate reductase n=1 Tax=Saccharothrix violaceirubra TaxID=413306 RepID=A0A7W7WWI1_9PSEU|nr:dihydrofolate reductase family protein [Saccharothrix violaceirubra]MBB4966136.1 dihydrofolate reductase [Saccharothrix violaceirubra]